MPRKAAALPANVGTQGAENFPIWTHFGICNRFPHISASFHRITYISSGTFQDNYSAISDKAGITKI
jgi:hypothetical protein